jgi:hypothetical protein
MNSDIEPSGKKRQGLRWLLGVAIVLFICWLVSFFEPILSILLMPVFILLFFLWAIGTKWLAKVIVVLFVCGLAGLFVPMCGAPLILVILLLLSASTPQMKRLVKVAIALFVGGALLGGTLFSRVVREPLLGLTFWFLPYVAAPILAIIVSAIQLRGKSISSGITHIFLIAFMLVFFLINSRTYIIMASPYIYMPPALTNENLKVYKECVEYVKNHEDLQNYIFKTGWLDVRERPSEPNAQESLWKTLVQISREPETEVIRKQCIQIMCPWFERRDNIVIFYKGNNPFIPETAKEIWHIWPSGHGIAYSLNGQDPNQSDDPILVKYKPFVRIHGNWYLSRGLFTVGNGRNYTSISPISWMLIDRSLSLDGIDPNKLD